MENSSTFHAVEPKIRLMSDTLEIGSKIKYFRQSENSSTYQSFEGIVKDLGYRRGVANPEWLEIQFKDDLKEGVLASQRLPVVSSKRKIKKC